MTLAGIRDMSIIDTPPEDRVPIKTYVVPYSDALVQEAIRRELERDGQVYFLHNRVHSIYHVANRLRYLVPEAHIGVAHGQLDERQLEQTMLDFFGGAYDVLVSTTIIENGLDVPNSNTIIIDDATNYGLAQLYQLRGRVGRSANRAYAYLLYRQDRPMTPEAQQRLEAIQEATELGSGFRIAMRDLEIRGAGNLLGSEQSGHIAAVGFDLYSRLLEQAVSQLKERTDNAAQAASSDAGQPDVSPASALPASARKVVVNEKVLVSPLVTLDLPLTAYLPEDYITDDAVRLEVYQRIAETESLDDVRLLRQELRDRFGDPPPPATHLLTWMQIKALALQAGVPSIVTTDDEFVIRLPIMRDGTREEIKRRFHGDRAVRVGPQFMRVERRGLTTEDRWIERLTGVLHTLAQ
jgi:transcription-repair coupling factor (superfamily II helicase)